jgi:hypothetical protein
MTKAELIKLNTPEPKMRRMRRLMLDAEKGVSHTVSLRGAGSVSFIHGIYSRSESIMLERLITVNYFMLQVYFHSLLICIVENVF